MNQLTSLNQLNDSLINNKYFLSSYGMPSKNFYHFDKTKFCHNNKTINSTITNQNSNKNLFIENKYQNRVENVNSLNK